MNLSRPQLSALGATALAAVSLVSPATAAPPAQRVFVGEAVTGSVFVGRGSDLTFLSFVAEQRPEGDVRMLASFCRADDLCTVSESTFPGTVSVVGTRATLKGVSDVVGPLHLTGSIVQAPWVDSATCWLSYDTGASRVDVAYEVSGSQAPMTWAGSVAGGRAWAPGRFGCGRHVSPGTVRVL